jgi:hypothetical protein
MARSLQSIRQFRPAMVPAREDHCRVGLEALEKLICETGARSRADQPDVQIRRAGG